MFLYEKSTMNDTCDSQNKSLDGPPRSFYENPNLELNNVVSITTANLNNMEEMVQLINVDENIWDYAAIYEEESDKISEEIKTLCKDTPLIDGKIKYYKKENHTRNEEVSEINQLLQERVITLEELENEKSELTRNLINKHKAIKQAINYYKKRLNIHVSIENKNKTDFVKINLFTQKENEFSFIFSINGDDKTMMLESTKPKISETRFTQIQTKFKKDQNICALLCCMRKVFLALK